MNVLDLAVMVLLVAAVTTGVRLGGVARAVSWGGLATGVGAGIVMAAAVAHLTARSSSALQLAASMTALMGGALAGQALGLAAARRLRGLFPRGGLRQVDRVAGGLVGLTGALVMVWLVLPSLSGVPGAISAQARGSLVGRTLDSIAPTPPDALAALRRLLEPSEGRVSLRPAVATVPPPTPGIPADVLVREEASTVEVDGAACQRLQVGSGFAVGSDLVLTNAHVVAGELQTTVTTVSGRRLAGRVVRFDPARDVALLRVPGLGLPPLPIRSAKVGETGAVLGHPEGQVPLAVAPASVADELTVAGHDIYGRSDTRRDVLVLGALVHPGDSGAPLVDRSGSAVGMVFAVSPERPVTAYALSRAEVAPDLVPPGYGAVSTSGCVEVR